MLVLRLTCAAALWSAIGSPGCGSDHAASLAPPSRDAAAPDVPEATDAPGAPDAPAIPPVPGAPLAPTQLQATGSLRNIRLRWTASEDAAGYHIYRRAGGGDFARLTSEPVSTTSYDDPIDSPAGDGVYYEYKVTAIGDLESAFSSPVRTMHGTRLAASYGFHLSTRRADSPYVVEASTTTFEATSGLTVSEETKLYLLEGAVLDFEVWPRPGEPRRIDMRGLIRATGSPSAPVRITAHQRGGGVLANGHGVTYSFQGVSYNPEDGSGSLLDHVEITNVATSSAGGINRFGSIVLRSGIKMTNVKISTTDTRGSPRFVVLSGWVILEDSYLHRIALSVATDVTGTPFSVTRNVFRGSSRAIVFDFVTVPGVRPGQIERNDFSGRGPALLTQVRGVGAIPLGNNYWGGGTGDPPVADVVVSLVDPATIATIDFDTPGPALAAQPPAGPDW